MNPKVTIALITDGEFNSKVLENIFNQDYDNYDVVLYGNKNPTGESQHKHTHLMNCVTNRNIIRKIAIKNKPDYVMFVDMDMIIPRNSITELVKQAEHNQKLYKKKTKKYNINGKLVREKKTKGIYAGWQKFREHEVYLGGCWVGDNEFEYFTEIKKGIVRTDVIPCGICLIPIRALKKVKFKFGFVGDKAAFAKKNIVFNSNYGLRFSGEVGSFSRDLQDKGYTLYLHSSVKTKHLDIGIERKMLKLYGLGTAKSGTHSLSEIFKSFYYSCHERNYYSIIEKVIEGRTDFQEILKRRYQNMDMDCSQLNIYLLKELLKDKDNKFILLIRDPYDWIESIINNSKILLESESPELAIWRRYQKCRFGEKQNFPKEEKILEDNGLFTIDNYLKYWFWYNKTVLTTVPKERLLIIKTKELSYSLNRIADFSGIDITTLPKEKSHVFKTLIKFDILPKINLIYLIDKIKNYKKKLEVYYE